MGPVNPRDNSWWVGASVWESSIQTLLPAKSHVHLCTPCLHPIPSHQAAPWGHSCPQTDPHTGLESFSELLRAPQVCFVLPTFYPAFSRTRQTSQEMLEGIFCLSVLGFPGARETSYISPDLNHQRRATASSHPSTIPIPPE